MRKPFRVARSGSVLQLQVLMGGRYTCLYSVGRRAGCKGWIAYGSEEHQALRWLEKHEILAVKRGTKNVREDLGLIDL